MRKLNSILLQFLLLINIFLFGSCKENPTSPIKNYSPLPGLFHGTWLDINAEPDSLHFSFDSTSMRFLEQAGYDFGIHREFAGNFSVNNSTLVLNYDDGNKSQFQYSFDEDTLILGDIWKYIRIATSPNNYGWSIKPPIISEQTYFIIGNIRAYCYSDSLAIILAPYNNNDLHLTILNTRDSTSTDELSNGTRAVDAVGSFLWFATDSMIKKRTLFDSTTMASFSYRKAVGSDYIADGIAVGTNYCYLMTVSLLDNKGMLLKFNLSGDLLDSTQTSPVIKDLCLVNDRLFCVDGDETFLELNPSTGYVITNYNLPGRPFGNNIDGIAFTGGTIQLAGRYSYGKLRISEIAIPSK
jgi:hypothetical protein